MNTLYCVRYILTGLLSISDLSAVWCVGSSIIKHAFSHSRNRPGGTNLGLERLGLKLWWQGYSGLQFTQIKLKLKLLQRIKPQPAYLLIHCGGNDIGRLTLGDLRNIIKCTIRYLVRELPESRIIWSQILPRQVWRYSNNSKAMESSRRRINSAIAAEVIRAGGAYIKYPDILVKHKSLFHSDGIHLSSLGNALFLNTLQGALEHFHITEGHVYPPPS